MAVFLAMMVMPFSRSRSIESMIRSATAWFSRKSPDCQSMASTRVVLPWSTWAMIAMLRMLSRCCISASYHGPCTSPSWRAVIMTATFIPPGGLAMIRFLTALVGVVALTVGVAFAQAPTTPPAAPAPPAAAKKVPTAVITMEKGGEIVLEFWPQDAPKHVERFIKLASEKFYDGQRVHRVEPGFVVQFGDPQSKTKPMDDPKMGTGGSGQTLKAEFNKRPFDRGVLGMADRKSVV